MGSTWHRQRTMKLRTRMIAVYAGLMTMLLLVYVLCFFHNYRKQTEILYEETTDSLSLFSASMEVRLNAIESISYDMVADASLQSWLSEYRRSGSGYYKTQLLANIEDKVFSYASSKWFTQSVTLVTPDFYVCRGTRTTRESETYLEELIELAETAKGRPVWCASKADPTTILQIRTYREVKNLSLVSMGTIMIRVNMNQMVDSLMQDYSFLDEDIPFIISDLRSGAILYPGGSVEEETAPYLKQDTNGYRIFTVGGKRMFAVSHTIGSQNWRYAMIIPYDTIFHSMTATAIWMLVVIFAATAFMIFASMRFSDSIVRHFLVLQEKMKRVQTGDFTPVHTAINYEDRNDEIGYLHQNFDRMTAELKKLTIENETKQTLLTEARIRALEMQINPHFLYNSLDMIYWQARRSGQNTICEAAEALAKVLQAGLASHEETWLLSEELQVCRYYLRIQRLRFGDRMVYAENIEEALLEHRVPYMCMQPLLENAIRYGVEPSVIPCAVSLRIYEDTDFRIAVSNEGSEVEDNLLEKLREGSIRPGGHGIGLLNIDTRVKLLYGEKYGLTVTTHLETVTFTLTLPLREKGELLC